ncbi:MAG: SAF domain-containing protein [Jatrophihabitantaceae bacterium]
MIPTSLHAPLTYLAGWPRRVAALLCLLIALALMLTSHHPPATATVPTVVASHPVPAGALLGEQDLSLVAWPARSVPADSAHASSSVAGRRAAANLSRGMPVTSADLLEPAIAAALAEGQAATTVVLANLSQLAILRIGDRVDLYPSMDTGVPPGSRPTGSPIAQAAEVLSILPASDTAPDAKPALVVATGRTAAAQLAIQGSGSFLATLVQPP